MGHYFQCQNPLEMDLGPYFKKLDRCFAIVPNKGHLKWSDSQNSSWQGLGYTRIKSFVYLHITNSMRTLDSGG